MTRYDQAELARAMLSEIGDALFLLDPDTDRLLEVNPVVLRLTGFSRAEALRFSALDLFRFEAAGGTQRLKAAFTKTMAFNGQDGFLLRTRGDDWVPVSVTVSRLHLAPRPLGLIIARDDRERRAVLAQVRRAEAELRTVLNTSPAALWSAERAPGPDVFAGWQFRYVSPLLLGRIAGRAADPFDHPFKWAEVIHPAEREAYRAALRRLLTEGEGVEQVYRVQAADGGVRWVRDRLRAVRDPAGRPVRLDGCLTDITEQRAAEAAVRRSEARFRALVEKSRDGILLLDEAGTVRYVTPAAKFIPRVRAGRGRRAGRVRVRPPGRRGGGAAAVRLLPQPAGGGRALHLPRLRRRRHRAGDRDERGEPARRPERAGGGGELPRRDRARRGGGRTGPAARAARGAVRVGAGHRVLQGPRRPVPRLQPGVRGVQRAAGGGRRRAAVRRGVRRRVGGAAPCRRGGGGRHRPGRAG